MLNWREVPFLRILLPFIIGIGFYLIFDLALHFNNYIILLLFCFIIYTTFIGVKFQWKSLNGLLIHGFFFILGYQIAFYHNDWNKKDHFRQYLENENLILGIVNNAPSKNERTVQINLDLKEIGQGQHSLKPCSGTLILRLRNDTASQKINYGDLLLLKSTIQIVPSRLNPETFDYKKYLHYKNIHYQAYAKSDQWRKLDRDQGNAILNWAFKTRSSLLEILNENLKNENEFAVASALILGYKEELTQELKNAYANTGAMHVLAVSGLHTGLIWGIIAFFLNWIPWKNPIWRWIKTGLTILGLWLFALITGASPSVLRAATMFTFLLIGIALNRNSNIYNTLAGSAFCLLLFNPYLLVDVGFQLSYFAVIGIVYFYKKIYNLWYIESKVGDYLWKLTSVAIAAQLTTFPLSLYYFHQFPAYFWLSGLVVVPFAFLILGTGLALFFVNKIIPFLSPILGKLLMASIWLMNAIIFLIEQLPSDFLKNIWIDESTMVLLYALLFSIIIAINTKQFKYLILGSVFLLLISFSSFLEFIAEDNPRIVFYQVSGKSYIEFIENGKAISFGDIEIDKKKIHYATHNYHMKHGISTNQHYHFGTNKLKHDHLFIQNEFLQFHDKKMAIIDELPHTIPDKKITLDYVLFRRRSTVSVETLNQFFKYDKIIIDGSLNKKRRIELMQQCLKEKKPFYDINKKGALIIEATGSKFENL